MLSDSEGSGEEAQQITVNEHYAKAYQARKEREELQKCKIHVDMIMFGDRSLFPVKDKYGSDFEEEDASDESTDSESAESEDEDGEQLTPAIDAAILRTLARIKRKDPSIYELGKSIYEEEQQRVTTVVAQKKKIKPVTLRQVALEASLRPNSRSPSPEPTKPTHVEEQQTLRDETIAAFHNIPDKGDDEDDDEAGGLLVPREKTRDELEREEEEYKKFLENEVGADLKDLITVEKVDADEGAPEGESSDIEADVKTKKKTRKKEDKAKGAKGKTKEQEDHAFLMNYILNRGWVDNSSRHIPTYKEVTSSKKTKTKSKPAAPDSSDHEAGEASDGTGAESDTSFESLVDHFEASYNFRFEEPGAATIQTFPRTLPDTVRRQESVRKDARARRQERKLAELEQKREEVRRMKNLKMKEMRNKLERIGKEGGRGRYLDDDQALQQLDLDADWDPEAHEAQMAELYGNEVEAVADDEKPAWDDDIDIGDIEDQPTFAEVTNEKTNKKKKKKKKKRAYDSDEDEGGVDVDEMDADVVRDNLEDEEEEWDGTEEMRKRKIKEYMAELDSLDFNDVVGGMSTRFRYVPVKQESFALTPAEILMATDQELNEYMGIKKYAPYRQGAKWDNQRNEKLRELKRAIAERVARAGTDGQFEDDRGSGSKRGGEKPQKKRKGRKERMKEKAAALADGANEGEEEQADTAETTDEQGMKRKREEVEGGEPSSTAEVSSKKRKRRHKKKNENDATS
ncbi:KRI1-like family C-terminal domain containing protein [Amanita muscaria]